jgi:uncharacterized protein
MRFKLSCVMLACSDNVQVFYYDNQTGLLHDRSGGTIGDPRPGFLHYTPSFKTDAVRNPICKHDSPRILKIQMGLSCDYSCSYCLQKYVPRAHQASVRLVPNSFGK